MNTRLFLTSLLAVNFSIQILYFPNFILENGGGAFLILFFLCVHFIAFPLLIAERIFDKKLRGTRLWNLESLSPNFSLIWFDRIFVGVWFCLRFVVLICFLWFFLYLGSVSSLYLIYFFKGTFIDFQKIMDLPTFPNMQLGLREAFLWCLLSLAIFLTVKKPFFRYSTRWFLPFCLSILFILFLRIVTYMSDYEGLKILFYPDFSGLTKQSLQYAIGHSLACLFVGFGFYDIPMIRSQKKDPIDVFVMSILQVLLLALFVGVITLPVIETVSEKTFGVVWLFEILPRWLSYDQFGYYNCFLFFLAITFICFYVSVLLIHLFNCHVDRVWSSVGKPGLYRLMNFMFVVVNTVVVLYFQTQMNHWASQGFLLNLNFIMIETLIPILALFILFFVFRYTNRKERMEVFSNQQLFYHNHVFFRLWKVMAFFGIPLVIVASWLLNWFVE